MKSPLRMFRGLTLQRNDRKEEKKQHRPPTKLDELAQATQDMQDMRNYYDSILSAACTTANNAHEFSEALEELGTCLLEKTALNDDEDSGMALMMMGKAQFELQKHFDVYRNHILKTMDKPSRSLLRELDNLEKMKCLCDAKREIYKNMLVVNRGKEGSRHPKSKTFSSKQLQEALASYEDEVDVFVFRLKSLKKGQFQSLLTQATRHHATQLSFFRRGLKTLEMVESHIKAVADLHHIDYKFTELDDNGSGSDDDDDDDVGSYYVDDGSDDMELSFDYQKNFQEQSVMYTSTNSIEENTDKSPLEMLNFSLKPAYSSKSAPIYADFKIDLAEKTEKPPISTRKFHACVLPTPADNKNENASSPTACLETKGSRSPPLWHSSPLEAKKPVKNIKVREFSSATMSSKNSISGGNNIYSGPIRMPSYSPEKPPVPQYGRRTVCDTNKLKRHAFSGPLTSKPFSSKSTFSASEYRHSMEIPCLAKSQPPLPPKVIPRTSPPVSAPKISELHELPRPPIDSERIAVSSSLVGYSGPLVSTNKVSAARSNILPDVSLTKLPLPTPLGHNRSYSTPSNSQRMSIFAVATLLGPHHNPVTIEEISSPPPMPLPVINTLPVSTTS
ncbi:hypothetical protein Cni_G21640 [Canna indica]|uniref:BAR domain-containing protein n=1 Tax=Canna indica TaxID=4628 RepID=A0AAQ3KW74_9LILI|nr:hypothetical protein Cni_G21640 [Canna indica]